MSVRTGVLQTGEASGIPIIQKLLQNTDPHLQFPTARRAVPAVMESIKDADYCLITEPIAFGVHNLQMVYELVRLFETVGVVINRCWMRIIRRSAFVRNTASPLTDP